MTNRKEQPSDPQSSFATTQWTRVLAARGTSDEARAALSDLCAMYYTPVHRFILHSSGDKSHTDDLAQEFFSQLLRRDSISHVNETQGTRFRSYLLGAVKHFLSDQHKKQHAQRRGGANQHVPIVQDRERNSDPGLVVPSVSAPADAIFDRQWAYTLLERALCELEASEEKANRTKQFDALKPWLTGEQQNKSQAELARELNSTEGAVKVMIHRLRKKFRQSLRREISQTVNNPDEVGDELRYLIEILATT